MTSTQTMALIFVAIATIMNSVAIIVHILRGAHP